MDEFDLDNLLSEDSPKEGITIVNARTKLEAVREAKKILYKIASRKTALFLSGEPTLKPLYESLAMDKMLIIGGGAMIDERFGEPNHSGSNEKMIKDTGLLGLFDNINAPFYGVLHDKTIDEETKDYDETVRYILSYFPKAVGVLAIGEDGHIAGIPAIPAIAAKVFDDKRNYVTSYSEWEKGYGERIILTPLALAVLDPLIVLVLGKEKKDVLKLMFEDGEASEVPARFFKRPEIAKKTILITDQRV